MRASILLSVLLLSVCAFGQELVVNGGFEQNGGVGTNQFTGWTVASQAGGSGSWYVQTGVYPTPSTERCSNETVAAPPSGFAAMSNQSNKGSHILYQDVAIPATGGKVTLTYDLFIYSHRAFRNQPTLDYNVIPNTQFRADILDPAAAATDVGSGVLANFYQSKDGDERYSPYKTYTVDLTPFAGRTIRLRFAQVDNIDCFNAGVDNVSIVAASCPTAAPSQVAIDYHCNGPCEAGLPVSFFAASPAYVFGSCDSYAWDFGDGTSATSAAPVHAFATAGTYEVNLAVTNVLGTTTAHASVTVVPPPPRRRTVRH